MIAEELPTDIADKCKMLNTVLGLHFSGIDLMLTPDNKWYCFEVNTSPAYSYFQLNTGLQISKARKSQNAKNFSKTKNVIKDKN